MPYFTKYRAAVLKCLPGWKINPLLGRYDHAIHPHYSELHLVFGLPRITTDLTVVHAVYPRTSTWAYQPDNEPRFAIPRCWRPDRAASALRQHLLPDVFNHYRKALVARQAFLDRTVQKT